MALTLRTAASLRKLQSSPTLANPQSKQAFPNSKQAESQFSQAIDSFYPGLDESPSDGAANAEGLVRYHTSKGENIQVLYSGDSKSGEYVHEWVGGGFLYTKFDENTVDNYQVMPGGVNHLHVDRKNPENSFVEASQPGFDLLKGEVPQGPSDMAADKMMEKDGVKYAVLQEGSDEEVADKGEAVLVHYTGWLKDGTRFDSSLTREKPFSFQLGAGGVIKGWETGVEGMKVGEKRLLDIPSHLAYGERERGAIPANSPLLFEVELLATSSEVTRPQ